MLIRSRKKQPIFVSFSGIDGAGKSTQIEALRARMERTGARVQVITFWDSVATLTRLREVSGHTLFKGDKGVGSPDRPINRRDKNVRSWRMTLIRLCLYFADAVSLRLVINRALKSEADFTIFDRYAYDELSNLVLSNPANRVYVRLIMQIVPRPNVSFLLDADPIQARARKPEYPVEFLHASRASYKDLSELIGGITIIDPMPAQEVEQHIWKHVLKQQSLDDAQIHTRLDEGTIHPTAS
jgi:thymidylate kinase